MAFEEIASRFWDTRRDYLVQEPLTDEALRATEEKYIEVFEEGRRSLENTRLWPRFRCSEVLGHMWPWQTRRLRAALREVEAAQTPEALVAHMRALKPELDRLLRSWIRKRRVGWAGDEQRLRQLKER